MDRPVSTPHPRYIVETRDEVFHPKDAVIVGSVPSVRSKEVNKPPKVGEYPVLVDQQTTKLFTYSSKIIALLDPASKFYGWENGRQRGREAHKEGVQNSLYHDPALREAYTQGPIPSTEFVSGWRRGWSESQVNADSPLVILLAVEHEIEQGGTPDLLDYLRKKKDYYLGYAALYHEYQGSKIHAADLERNLTRQHPKREYGLKERKQHLEQAKLRVLSLKTELMQKYGVSVD